MKQRRIVGILTVLVTTLAACVLFFWPNTSVANATTSAAPPPVVKPVHTPRIQHMLRKEPTHTAHPQTFVSTTEHEEALKSLAEYSGKGLVRCTLPEALSDVLPANTGRPGSLPDTLKTGNILTFPVSNAFGRTALRDGYGYGDVLGQVHWSNAHAGLLGDCHVEVINTVWVSLHVIDEEGTSVPNAQTLPYNSVTYGAREYRTDANGVVRVPLLIGHDNRIEVYVRPDDYNFSHDGRRLVNPSAAQGSLEIQVKESNLRAPSMTVAEQNARTKKQVDRLAHEATVAHNVRIAELQAAREAASTPEARQLLSDKIAYEEDIYAKTTYVFAPIDPEHPDDGEYAHGIIETH